MYPCEGWKTKIIDIDKKVNNEVEYTLNDVLIYTRSNCFWRKCYE